MYSSRTQQLVELVAEFALEREHTQREIVLLNREKLQDAISHEQTSNLLTDTLVRLHQEEDAHEICRETLARTRNELVRVNNELASVMAHLPAVKQEQPRPPAKRKLFADGDHDIVIRLYDLETPKKKIKRIFRKHLKRFFTLLRAALLGDLFTKLNELGVLADRYKHVNKVLDHVETTVDTRLQPHSW